MKRMFLLAVVVVVAICLLDQDAVAAQPLGITLPEDPTKAYITLGILFVAAIMFGSSGFSVGNPCQELAG